MKRIFGCVLVKGTNIGIPNLIVTAYDSETSIRDIVGGRSIKKDFSLRDIGERIGSVLTDQTGGFLIERDDLEFQGNESRPNLLMIVFAPEDVQDVKTPLPLPPEERILYISTGPREDAGAEEAFVIRLLQEQLDHFDITSAATRESNTDDHRLATSIEDAWNVGDRLRRRLQPRLVQEHKKSEEFLAQAQEKVGNLSAIPRYLRDDDLTNNSLLITGRQDLALNLKQKQGQAVAKGLERLQTRKRVMHLGLTETELEDLGLRLKDGKVIGDIDSGKLTERVRAKINGLDLVRKRGMDNPRPEVLIRKYLLEAPVLVDDKDDTAEK